MLTCFSSTLTVTIALLNRKPLVKNLCFLAAQSPVYQLRAIGTRLCLSREPFFVLRFLLVQDRALPVSQRVALALGLRLVPPPVRVFGTLLDDSPHMRLYVGAPRGVVFPLAICAKIDKR